MRSGGGTHVNVLQGEKHRVVNEHAAGFFVDRGGDDVRVDGDVAAVGVVGHLDGGVLCAEELAQVFIEHKHEFGNSCLGEVGGGGGADRYVVRG